MKSKYWLFWSHMVLLGPTWSYMVSFDGPTWSYVVLLGPMWSYLVLFDGPTWSYLVLLGPMWSYVVLLGPTWSYVFKSYPYIFGPGFDNLIYKKNKL